MNRSLRSTSRSAALLCGFPGSGSTGPNTTRRSPPRWAATCSDTSEGGQIMSSSINRTRSPRATLSPALRAAAWPRFRCSKTCSAHAWLKTAQKLCCAVSRAIYNHDYLIFAVAKLLGEQGRKRTLEDKSPLKVGITTDTSIADPPEKANPIQVVETRAPQACGAPPQCYRTSRRLRR